MGDFSVSKWKHCKLGYGTCANALSLLLTISNSQNLRYFFEIAENKDYKSCSKQYRRVDLFLAE